MATPLTSLRSSLISAAFLYDYFDQLFVSCGDSIRIGPLSPDVHSPHAKNVDLTRTWRTKMPLNAWPAYRSPAPASNVRETQRHTQPPRSFSRHLPGLPNQTPKTWMDSLYMTLTTRSLHVHIERVLSASRCRARQPDLELAIGLSWPDTCTHATEAVPSDYPVSQDKRGFLVQDRRRTARWKADSRIFRRVHCRKGQPLRGACGVSYSALNRLV